MKCDHCDIVERQAYLYADDTVVVAIRDKVFTAGQITVFSKEHYPILEVTPDSVVAACAAVANKVSIAAFESLGSKGTNIIVKNGLGAGQNVPHFGIEVIPRQEEDGLQLQWEPKPLPEDELETSFILLQEALKEVEKNPPPKLDDPVNEESSKEGPKEKKKNYLLKSIKRIP